MHTLPTRFELPRPTATAGRAALRHRLFHTLAGWLRREWQQACRQAERRTRVVPRY